MGNSNYNQPIVNANRTPLQQSLSGEMGTRDFLNTNRLLLGIVLEVYYSDDPRTVSAASSPDYRGAYAECSVLIVGVENTPEFLLDKVIIPPNAPSGLDNYQESYPRGCSGYIDGSEASNAWESGDPSYLDGDWCVVGFLDSNMDRPFIISWWHHPSNTWDRATTGWGSPTEGGVGQTLDQINRRFSRVNGVETIITKEGDIYLSTKLAGTNIVIEGDIERGRLQREGDPSIGGNIQCQLKKDAALELVWDDLEDGQGLRFRAEDDLPQTNPQLSPPESHRTPEKTYLYFDQDTVDIRVPVSFKVSQTSSITLDATSTTRIFAEDEVTVDAEQVYLGREASQSAVRGEDLRDWLEALTVQTAMGPAKINPADIATFIDVLSTKVKVI